MMYQWISQVDFKYASQDLAGMFVYSDDKDDRLYPSRRFHLGIL